MLRHRFFILAILLLLSNFLIASKVILSANGNTPTKLTDFGHIYEWALKFKEKNPNFIIAAIGRPSAPLYHHLKKGMSLYVESLNNDQPIIYGKLQGEKEYREKIAKSLTRLYDTDFNADNILFTVGGRIGLSAISNTIKTLYPNKKIVLTLPYYPDHRKHYSDDELILVDTLHNHALTAENLEKTLEGISPNNIGAFIFCSPNNPMGWVVSKDEWKKIAVILSRYKNSMIVLDEAYAELVLTGEHVSLVTVAPHLKQRIILLRSATKGLSAAGERMAILATWNKKYLTYLNEFQFKHLIHPPKSSQFAYSYAMEHFSTDDSKKLADFYRPMVRGIESQLRNIGLLYNKTEIQGAFYAIIDLRCLIGKPIDHGVQGVYGNKKSIIEDDIDLAFHLMSKHGLALMPLSLFGVEPNLGLLRITCSLSTADQDKLKMSLKGINQELRSQK